VQTRPILKSQSQSSHDAARAAYTASRRDQWDEFAQWPDRRRIAATYYHRRLTTIYQFLVAPNQRVLDVGCGNGDLLSALRPGYGVGVDFSAEAVQRAAIRHPGLRFVQADALELSDISGEDDEPFDVIIMSDLLNDVWDVQTVLEQLAPFVGAGTRIIINSYSRMWEWPLAVAEKMRLAKPVLSQNWLTVEDIAGLLHLSGFQLMRAWQEILLPLPIPLIAPLANRILVKLPFFRMFGLTNFIVAKPNPAPVSGHKPARAESRQPTVSVLVPARNEAGNIERIFDRTPEMGGGTELVFVEGHSKDDTYETIERTIAAHPERRCRLLRQQGAGQGDAVRMGFAAASGDVLMILDADLTVPPEDLPRFYNALCSGKGDFINGVRLVYPMEKHAMRMFNFLGNKFFSLVFSYLLGQPIKDTLCGTKVMWRHDYKRLAANRSYFGDFDPFGDFDLLFGAAKLNLAITEVPIRYRERTYGETNIQRWKHGLLLLRMCLFACGRIKFI
jgi:2-polyprenyl-3-methyl-5-hydroxy-6-metoxy-1,4-benzoquinol methylase